jgi:hypothetical protein
MSLTDAYETQTLKYLLTADSLTRPLAWYGGLFTSDPTDAAITSGEVSGYGYSRKAVSFSVSGDTATNSSAVDWPAAKGGSWGTVTHIAIFDAPTDGNMIVTAQLSSPIDVSAGSVARISAGDLAISIN